MKKIFYTLAVAALLAACNNQQEAPVAEKTAETPAQAASQLKIAYVLIDTLTNQYELFKEANENFQKKQANAEAPDAVCASLRST